jgi:hypothetical protein
MRVLAIEALAGLAITALYTVVTSLADESSRGVVWYVFHRRQPIGFRL